MVKNKVNDLTTRMYKELNILKRRKLLENVTFKEYCKYIEYAICPDSILEEGYGCESDVCNRCKKDFFAKHKSLFKKEKKGNSVW